MDLPCLVLLGLHSHLLMNPHNPNQGQGTAASEVLRINCLVFGRCLGTESEKGPTKERRRLFPAVFGWCWCSLQAGEKQGSR